VGNLHGDLLHTYIRLLDIPVRSNPSGPAIHGAYLCLLKGISCHISPRLRSSVTDPGVAPSGTESSGCKRGHFKQIIRCDLGPSGTNMSLFRAVFFNSGSSENKTADVLVPIAIKQLVTSAPLTNLCLTALFRNSNCRYCLCSLTMSAQLQRTGRTGNNR
jgi:hypothetical protein